MNPYIEKLKPYLSEREDNLNARSLQDIVFECYRELHPLDGGEVRSAFDQLDQILDKLPLREYEQMWSLTCRLCSAHEEPAFLEGIRVGIQLATEPWT